MSLPKAQLDQLRMFVGVLRQNPDLLHTPDLAFFKEYLLAMGANVPEPKPKPQGKAPEPEPMQKDPEPEPEPEAEEPEPESDPESEVELDMDGVIRKSVYSVSAS